MSEWQDISTAPKDGSEILIWNGQRSVAYWNGDSWDDGDYRDHILGITHWSKLPEPPK